MQSCTMLFQAIPKKPDNIASGFYIEFVDFIYNFLYISIFSFYQFIIQLNATLWAILKTVRNSVWIFRELINALFLFLISLGCHA